MRTAAQLAGDRAEERVAAELTREGWRILGRHVHLGRAELDLVAVDPGPPPGLVVVEVRFRSGRDFGLPEETVDRRKILRLWGAGAAIRAAGRLPDGTAVPALAVRVDLVVLEPGRPPRHHRHVG